MITDKTNNRLNEIESLLLHVDGGCEPKNPGGVATAGWVLYEFHEPNNPIAEQFAVVSQGGNLSTNNYGEYSSLELALDFLIKNNWKGDLTIRADSKLLVEQVRGSWKCKAEHLKIKRDLIRVQLNKLGLQIITKDNPIADEGRKSCFLEWIPREINEYANDLCRKAYQHHLTS